MSTSVVNREAVALGMAELYLGPSAANIASVDNVLGSSHYLGAQTEVSLEITKEFYEQYGKVANTKVLENIFTLTAGIAFNLNLYEITIANLGFALGGDGSDVEVLNLLLSNPTTLRAELKFTYPNKINFLYFILPCIKVYTETVQLGFKDVDAALLPLRVEAIATDDATWIGNELGRCLFI